jgi:predicted dehydrogenase
MNRRDFLRGSASTTLLAALGSSVIELKAEARQAAADAPAGPPVTCAVIGLGKQGREILASLAKLGNAPVAYICDTYNSPGFLKRSQDIVPSAKFVTDYKQVLDDATVKAVFIATPSHQHKQIVLDAIAAGKHVYCEAPLASDLSEAKAIAQAGAGAKTVFQAGLQLRSNKQNLHVLEFIRSDALGNIALGRGQWHDKMSWRQVAPTQDREQELNWRLRKDTSSGLPGEIGIHQFDVATWFLKQQPIAITGMGAIMQWTQDGMEVPDTIQLVVEYPNNIRYTYDATLANSFDGTYDVFLGSNSAVMLRDQRAWMFKETDAPLLGWEVYARKDKLGVGDTTTGTGIALVADATKLLAQGKQPADAGTDVTKTSLYQAIDGFLGCVRTGGKPAAGALEGYRATVVAHKAHEATLTNSRIVLDKALFEIS